MTADAPTRDQGTGDTVVTSPYIRRLLASGDRPEVGRLLGDIDAWNRRIAAEGGVTFQQLRAHGTFYGPALAKVRQLAGVAPVSVTGANDEARRVATSRRHSVTGASVTSSAAPTTAFRRRSPR